MQGEIDWGKFCTDHQLAKRRCTWATSYIQSLCLALYVVAITQTMRLIDITLISQVSLWKLAGARADKTAGGERRSHHNLSWLLSHLSFAEGEEAVEKRVSDSSLSRSAEEGNCQGGFSSLFHSFITAVLLSSQTRGSRLGKGLPQLSAIIMTLGILHNFSFIIISGSNLEIIIK